MKFYMVQRYSYVDFHTDNKFPTQELTFAFKYLRDKVKELEEEGIDIRWDGEESFQEYYQGFDEYTSVAVWSIEEFEFDKEID